MEDHKNKLNEESLAGVAGGVSEKGASPLPDAWPSLAASKGFPVYFGKRCDSCRAEFGVRQYSLYYDGVEYGTATMPRRHCYCAACGQTIFYEKRGLGSDPLDGWEMV